MVQARVVILAMFMAVLFGLGLSGYVVAAEKVKLRTVMYGVRWETLDLTDEEGHLIGILEGRGVQNVVQGKGLCDGCVVKYGALVDVNTKSGTGSGRGYGEVTDRDGDKYWYNRRGKPLRFEREMWVSYWEGEVTIVRGTGKYKGIKGKGTWSAYGIAPGQWYYDEEIEVELANQ